MHAALLLVVLSAAAGEEKAPAAWGDPRLAIAAAVADAQQLGPQAIFVRYIWNPVPDPAAVAWHTQVVNECVSAIDNPMIVRPTVLADGYLLRWDLRELAPRVNADGSADVFRLMEVWDRIFDPYLQVKLLAPLRIRIATPPYVASDGKTYRHKIVERSTTTSDLYEPSGSQLQAACLTNVPIVSLPEFMRACMTTVDGGLYYDFLDLPETLDELLELVGAERERAESQRADIKAVSVRSDITHAPRRIIVLRSIGSRPSENQGLVWLTEDFAKGELPPDVDPARNLQGRKRDAGENIGDRANGGHWYYLHDKDGRRQDSAPDNIASDKHFLDTRLQPAKSCIVCHAIEKSRGIRSFAKDVDATLAHGPVEQVGERGVPLGQEFDQASRTVGQYHWDPRKMVDRARDDYSDFCVRCTGTMQPEDIGEMTRQFFTRYEDAAVTPTQACAELGIDPPADDQAAGELLRQRCPPLPVELLPGVLPEDIYVATLMKGRAIPRSNFLQIVLELRRRLITAAAAQGGNPQ